MRSTHTKIRWLHKVVVVTMTNLLAQYFKIFINVTVVFFRQISFVELNEAECF